MVIQIKNNDDIIIRWTHERMSSKLAKCREANRIENENNRILNKVILSQTLREKEIDHKKEISSLCDEVQIRDDANYALKDHLQSISTKLVTVEAENSKAKTDLLYSTQEVENLLKIKSESEVVISNVNRNLVDLKLNEIELKKELNRNCNKLKAKSRQLETVEKKNKQAKTLIKDQHHKISQLEEEVCELRNAMKCLEIKKKQIDDKYQQYVGSKWYSYNRKKSMKRKHPSAINENKVLFETGDIAQLKEKNNYLSRELTEKDAKMTVIAKELALCSKQRDFYRSLLRGKNISKLVNINQSKEVVEMCCKHEQEREKAKTCGCPTILSSDPCHECVLKNSIPDNDQHQFLPESKSKLERRKKGMMGILGKGTPAASKHIKIEHIMRARRNQ